MKLKEKVTNNAITSPALKKKLSAFTKRENVFSSCHNQPDVDKLGGGAGEPGDKAAAMISLVGMGAAD